MCMGSVVKLASQCLATRNSKAPRHTGIVRRQGDVCAPSAVTDSIASATQVCRYHPVVESSPPLHRSSQMTRHISEKTQQTRVIRQALTSVAPPRRNGFCPREGSDSLYLYRRLLEYLIPPVSVGEHRVQGASCLPTLAPCFLPGPIA